MRERLFSLIESKTQVTICFQAGDGAKLISISGTFVEVGDDFAMAKDIYGNHMLIPLGSIAYVEIKK